MKKSTLIYMIKEVLLDTVVFIGLFSLIFLFGQ